MKNIIMGLIAIIALASIYLGVQQYKMNHNDSISHEDRSSHCQCNKADCMCTQCNGNCQCSKTNGMCKQCAE